MPAFSLGSAGAFAVTLTGAQTIQAAKTFLSPAAASVPLIAQAITGQTADLQRWQDAAGGIRSSITTEGRHFIAPIGNGMASVLIRNAASQTVDSLSVQNNAGTVLSRIDSAGNVIAPALGMAGPGYTGGFITGLNSRLHILTGDTGGQGITIRGLAGQVGNLQEWQNDTGVVMGRAVMNGEFAFRYLKGGNPAVAFPLRGQFEVQTETATSIAVVIRGAAAQTGDLQQWTNSANTIVSKINAEGGAAFSMNAAGNYGTTFGTLANYGSLVRINSLDAGIVGLTVRGASGQAANLVNFQDVNGTTMSHINASGHGYFAAMHDNGVRVAHRGNYSRNSATVDPNVHHLPDATDLNGWFATGVYNINTPVNNPWTGAGTANRWTWLQVFTHISGAHWQKQIIHDMTGGGSSYERRCTGGDPTLASSWTGWAYLHG